jgi:hypothetical protein
MDSGQTSSAVNRNSRFWSSELGMGQAILSISKYTHVKL